MFKSLKKITEDSISASFLCFWYTSPLLAIWLTPYVLFFTDYWILMLSYIIWIVLDRQTFNTTGRSSDAFRNSRLIHNIQKYFPVTLEFVNPQLIEENRNYVFCSFPHGFLSAGFMFGIISHKGFKGFFPKHNFYPVTLPQAFWFPIYREITAASGAITSSFGTLSKILEKPVGNILGLTVGGAEESYLFRPGVYKCVLRNRKGFVKLALKTGTSLVPCFAFGEVDIFDQVTGPWIKVAQDWFKRKTGIAPIIPKGRGFFQPSYVPFQRPINVVVGNPIEVEKVEEPSQEQIDSLHAKFINDLAGLFEEKKYKYLGDPENTNLEII